MQELQNLYSVAIVEGDKVAFRNVKVGQRVDSLWVIEEGLKPGEQVVVEGLQRIQDGMTVSASRARGTSRKCGPGGRRGEVTMARFFVNRPIVAIVISIITVLLGVVAMSGLPISQYPEVVPPMVQVTTTFIGASATDVEASVATPLEQKINGVENMIYMKFTNANDGTLTLKVSFEVGSNLDMNNVLTQNRVSEGMPQMPQSVKNYGVSVKKALAFPLVISIVAQGTHDSAFSRTTRRSTSMTPSRASRASGRSICSAAATTPCGVAAPDVIGRLGITIPDIANAISQQNQLTPAGQIGGPPAATGTGTYTVRTQGRLLNEEEFANIIVRTNPDGSEVRLKDIARLELGTMLYNSIGRHDSTPSAVIAVFQIPAPTRSTSPTGRRRWKT